MTAAPGHPGMGLGQPGRDQDSRQVRAPPFAPGASQSRLRSPPLRFSDWPALGATLMLRHSRQDYSGRPLKERPPQAARPAGRASPVRLRFSRNPTLRTLYFGGEKMPTPLLQLESPG